MLKLDAYDKKILEILINNSRTQVTTIAKKVKLKRENVNYKIQRMQNTGLIKEFNIIINEGKLKLTHYTAFIELINLKDDSEKQILGYLEKSKYMTWIGPAAGKWSLIFDVILNEDAELDVVMKDLFDKFGKFIGEYSILRVHGGNFYNLKPLGISKKRTELLKKTSPIKLDKKDLTILSALNKNARTNLVIISEKVGLTPNGVNKRIKNLEKSGIIEGYTTSVDWKKLGYEWYTLQLKLTQFNKEANTELTQYFENHKKITAYARYFGGIWDYDIGLLVKNSDELRSFINDFRTKFHHLLKISDVFLVLGELVGYKLPQGVFENATQNI
ncbi:MAG: winged helix-turn-helix transcriptional regulator [archaeon]